MNKNFYHSLLSKLKLLPNPLVSAIYGYSVSGPIGAAVGFGSSLVDEILINYNYYDKHYLSTTILYNSMIAKSSFGNLSMLPNSLNLMKNFAAASGLSYFLNDSFNFNEIVDNSISSFKHIDRLFDYKYSSISKKDINIKNLYNLITNIESDPLTILIAEIAIKLCLTAITRNIDVVVNEKLLSFDSSFFNLGSNSDSIDVENILIEILKFSPMILISKTSNAISYVITNYITSYKDDIIKKKIDDLIYDKNIITKFSANNERSSIIRDIDNDFRSMISNLNYFSSSITDIYQNATAINEINKLSPDLLLPYLSFHYIYDSVYNYIYILKNNLTMRGYNNEKYSLKNELLRNAKSISERDGIDYLKNKISKLDDTSSTDRHIYELYESLQRIVDGIYDIGSLVLDWFLIAPRIVNKSIEIEKFVSITTNLGRLKNVLINKNSYNSEDSYEKICINNINKFFSIIDENNHNKIIYLNNLDKAIKISDLNVSFGNNNILSDIDLELKLGKHYAFTGLSGCGKSTLLNLIKYSGSLSDSEGSISIPIINQHQAKITMLTQADYWPISDNLLESIYFPNNLPDYILERNILKNKALKILNELKMGNNETISSKIEEKNINWENILSGGQKKKLFLTSAILNNPDILILDETFNGLDKYSMIKAQSVINEYLPNSLIIVVDHHADDNNWNSFYDSKINFQNHSIEVKPIYSRELNSIDKNYYELLFLGSDSDIVNI